MVTNIQQAADGNYLLIHNVPDRKLKSILAIYPHGRDTLFVSFQNFIIQSIVAEQVRNGISGGQQENSLLVTSYNFRLIAVLLVSRFTLRVEFTQIVFVKLDSHALSFLCAKLFFFVDIRK